MKVTEKDGTARKPWDLPSWATVWNLCACCIIIKPHPSQTGLSQVIQDHIVVYNELVLGFSLLEPSIALDINRCPFFFEIYSSFLIQNHIFHVGGGFPLITPLVTSADLLSMPYILNNNFLQGLVFNAHIFSFSTLLYCNIIKTRSIADLWYLFIYLAVNYFLHNKYCNSSLERWFDLF